MPFQRTVALSALAVRRARGWRLAGLPGLVLALVGCGGEAPPPAPFEAVHDVAETMRIVLEPAADVIWGSAGQVITADGVEDLAPTTDEGWLRVAHAAAVAAESGNLLMLPDRARDGGEWMEISRGLVSAGRRARVAAEAQDADALFAAGGLLYNVCVSCHQQYWLERPQRPGEGDG